MNKVQVLLFFILLGADIVVASTKVSCDPK